MLVKYNAPVEKKPRLTLGNLRSGDVFRNAEEGISAYMVLGNTVSNLGLVLDVSMVAVACCETGEAHIWNADLPVKLPAHAELYVSWEKE